MLVIFEFHLKFGSFDLKYNYLAISGSGFWILDGDGIFSFIDDSNFLLIELLAFSNISIPLRTLVEVGKPSE
jgi:hypothetical protein